MGKLYRVSGNFFITLIAEDPFGGRADETEIPCGINEYDTVRCFFNNGKVSVLRSYQALLSHFAVSDVNVG